LHDIGRDSAKIDNTRAAPGQLPGAEDRLASLNGNAVIVAIDIYN
jgi:hypothetical protein